MGASELRRGVVVTLGAVAVVVLGTPQQSKAYNQYCAMQPIYGPCGSKTVNADCTAYVDHISAAGASCTNGAAVVCRVSGAGKCDGVGIDATHCILPLQPAGTACNDGKACTGKDACDSSGKCVGQPIPAGGACDDGNPCTYGETCNSSAVCQGGTTLTCTSTDCLTRTCNGTSTCASSPKPNGTSCHLTTLITSTCNNGVCGTTLAK